MGHVCVTPNPYFFSSFSRGVESIKAWTIQNKLKLNDAITEVLVVGSCSGTCLIDSPSIEIGANHIPFSACDRDLGVHLDSTLSMHEPINYLCRPSFLALRGIASIRSYLTESTSAQLASSFITTRLDHCNSILLVSQQLK